MFFQDYFSQDFQTGTTSSKSNAGERISKFFVEKKIFYSLLFFTENHKKTIADFFCKTVRKYLVKTALRVNPVTQCWYMFYPIMNIFFVSFLLRLQ